MRKILSCFKLNKLSSRGFSVVETMIALGMIAGVSVVGVELTKQVSTMKASNRSKTGAILIRNRILTAVNSPAGWSKTISLNPNLACLNTANGNCTGASGPISVFDMTGVQLTWAGDPNRGFDVNGQPCAGFSNAGGAGTGAGNDNCPFQYNVSWRAICTTNPCPAPQVEITADIVFSPRINQASLNTSNFSMRFIRGDMTQNIYQDVCLSMGGLYNAGSKTCTLPYLGNCPAGTVVLGFDPATNSKVCGTPWVSPMCDPGQVLKGTDAAGNAICIAQACTGWTNPTGWTEEPIGGRPVEAWGGSDGGCDGADGGCDGGGGGGS